MRPTILHVGGVLYWTIQTRNPDTMVLKDADSTPSVAVRKNGSAVGDSVTITKRSATTGLYDCSYNPAAEVEGDSFQFEESAEVTGTTTGSATYVNQFSVRVRALERGTDGANTTTPANSAIADAKAASEAVVAKLPTTDFLAGAATDDGYAVLDAATKMQIDALTRGLIAGVVGSSSSTTVINVTSTESGLAVTDQLKGRVLIFNKDTTTGALRGQGAPIETNDTTSITVASGDAFTTAPASGDTFTIY